MDYGVIVGGVWIVACSRAVRRSKEGLLVQRNLESHQTLKKRGNKMGSVIGGSSFRNLDINLDCNYVALESL